jgi:hypothetical protein
MTLHRAAHNVSPCLKPGSRQAAAVARLDISRQALLVALARPASHDAALAPALRLVRRHPAWAMALAALAGGLLVRARVWRWALSPRLLGRWLPVALAALTATPSGGIWTDLLASILGGSRSARGQAEKAPSTAAAAAAGQADASP